MSKFTKLNFRCRRKVKILDENEKKILGGKTINGTHFIGLKINRNSDKKKF